MSIECLLLSGLIYLNVPINVAQCTTFKRVSCQL